MKPRQADQLRLVVRNNWKDNQAKKREDFQNMLLEMLRDGQD